MHNPWKGKIMCMERCSRCGRCMNTGEERILSVYDHEPICMECKNKEENRFDYDVISNDIIGKCIDDTETAYSMDVKGYCYHHFYPYKCDKC